MDELDPVDSEPAEDFTSVFMSGWALAAEPRSGTAVDLRRGIGSGNRLFGAEDLEPLGLLVGFCLLDIRKSVRQLFHLVRKIFRKGGSRPPPN